MKQGIAILALAALLALPAVVGAEEKVTRTGTDATQLIQLLVQKGVITPQEQAELTTRPVVTPPMASDQSTREFRSMW